MSSGLTNANNTTPKLSHSLSVGGISQTGLQNKEQREVLQSGLQNPEQREPVLQSGLQNPEQREAVLQSGQATAVPGQAFQSQGMNSSMSFSSPYTSTTGYSRPYSSPYSPPGYSNSGFYSGYNNYGGMMGGAQNMMMMNGPGGMPGQQQMETSFRHEYQGVLQGLNSIFHILYAGVGMLTYGPRFIGFILNACKSVLRASFKVLARLFGLSFVGKVFSFLRLGKGFEIIGSALEGAWRDSRQPNTSISKVLLYTRIILIIGLTGLFFVRRALNNQIKLEEERQRQELINRAMNMHEIHENHEDELSETNSLKSIDTDQEADKQEDEEKKTDEKEDGNNNKEEEEKLNTLYKEASETQRNSHQELRSEEFWTPKTLSQQSPPLEEQKLKSVLNQNFIEQPEVKVEETSNQTQEPEKSPESVWVPAEKVESSKVEEVIKKTAVDKAKPWLSKSFSKN